MQKQYIAWVFDKHFLRHPEERVAVCFDMTGAGISNMVRAVPGATVSLLYKLQKHQQTSRVVVFPLQTELGSKGIVDEIVQKTDVYLVVCTVIFGFFEIFSSKYTHNFNKLRFCTYCTFIQSNDYK